MVNDEHKIEDEKRLKRWFNRRRQAAKNKDSHYSYFAGALVSLILLIEIWLVIPGIPTGLGIVTDYIVITGLYLVAFYLIYLLLSPLLKFFYLTRYTYLVVVTAALGIQTYVITRIIAWNNEAALIFSVIIVCISLIISIYITYLWFNSRKRTLLAIAILAILAIVCINGIKQLQLQQASPVSEPTLLQNILIEQQSDYHYNTIPLTNNPAEHGSYQFKHLTYSSSIEQQAAAFVHDENEERSGLVFPSVDGSDVLQDWSWTKQLYWGFTEQDISISGELWIPEGDGPFPIVYIMHGNHISETDSSVGYTYLGELLASHGFIVSSIDANFLNFSAWSGIVDNDQLLRAWLYLAHIDSFYQANLLPVDWNNVALIGHSRGGQAAAMAVDINKWLEDNDQASILDQVNINAVIGIAPTDYTVDGKLPHLNNVSYLTLHGTLDSDLTEFFGERQFERTTIYNKDAYKASVIIYGANHGQFNEAWGKYDEQLPGALILNTEHILDEQAQQMAAKVFINGFLKSIFSQQHEYRQLFQDHRVAHNDLPIAGYITQYEDANMDYYYTFENEQELKPVSSSAQLSYNIVELKGRNGSSKYNDVLSLEWNIGYSKINFPIKQRVTGHKPPVAAFVFQMAKTQASKHIDAIAEMNIEVDFIAEETIARIDMKNSFSLLDPYFPSYLKLDFLEQNIKNGKYEPKEELYLQTYIIPVELIRAHAIGDSEWNSNKLTAIQFWFKDRSGSMLLDDIGVIYEGGSYVKYES